MNLETINTQTTLAEASKRINDNNAAHRLVFTNGILTEHTQESINDGN